MWMPFDEVWVIVVSQRAVVLIFYMDYLFCCKCSVCSMSFCSLELYVLFIELKDFLFRREDFWSIHM